MTKTFACGCTVERAAINGRGRWTPCVRHQPYRRDSGIVKTHHDDPVPAFLLGYTIHEIADGPSPTTVESHSGFHSGGGEYGGAGASGSWDSGSSSSSDSGGSSGGDSGGGGGSAC